MNNQDNIKEVQRLNPNVFSLKFDKDSWTEATKEIINRRMDVVKWEFPIVRFEGKYYNQDKTREVMPSNVYYVYTSSQEDLSNLTEAEKKYLIL